MEIHGFCEERFRPAGDAFRANFDAGLELGANLAVVHRGNFVVDLWAGYADPDRTRPWSADTITLVYSTTKIAAILSLLMIIDRGLVELDAPIARYWPEFAANGKAQVTVRDALTHQAGVPGCDPPIRFEAMADWDRITAHIAAGPHWFDGKRVICYHSLTMGFILGELVRRTDGRGLAQFFREEVASRLGADFQIGLTSAADRERVAVQEAGPVPTPPDPLAARVWNSISLPIDWAKLTNADIPSANGYGNGRSIARFCAVLANRGELDGVRYLSRQLVDEMCAEQVRGGDPFLGEIRLGLGVGLHCDAYPAPSPSCVHWGGYGGSWALIDPQTGVSSAYAPNRLAMEFDDIFDPRHKRIWKALERILPTLS